MTDEGSFTPLERRVLATCTGLVARCVAGFDDALLDGVRDALLEAVEHDGLAVIIEEAESGTFRLLALSAVGPDAAAQVLPKGEHREHSPTYVRFSVPAPSTRPRVVEDARASDLPLARAVAKAGILSYVMVPLLHGEKEVGWLVVRHHVPGAPSQRSLPLLAALCEVIAPAVLRARTAERERVVGSLVDGSPDGMIALDPSGAVVEANASAVRFLERTRPNVLGKPLRSLVDEETFGTLLRVLLREPRPGQPPMESSSRARRSTSRSRGSPAGRTGASS